MSNPEIRVDCTGPQLPMREAAPDMYFALTAIEQWLRGPGALDKETIAMFHGIAAHAIRKAKGE